MPRDGPACMVIDGSVGVLEELDHFLDMSSGLPHLLHLAARQATEWAGARKRMVLWDDGLYGFRATC